MCTVFEVQYAWAQVFHIYVSVKQEQKWVPLKSDSSALYMHLKLPVSTIENEERKREGVRGGDEWTRTAVFLWEQGNGGPDVAVTNTLHMLRVYKPLQVHHKQTAKNKPVWFDSVVKTNYVRVAKGHRINSWSKNGFKCLKSNWRWRVCKQLRVSPPSAIR